jgi:hypothetical protein
MEIRESLFHAEEDRSRGFRSHWMRAQALLTRACLLELIWRNFFVGS